MTMPSLPPQGSTTWYSYMQALDTQARSVVNTEGAQDAAAALFTGGTHTGISFAYDDAGNAVNATVASGSGGTSPMLDVTDFGAVGDGTTDDMGAFQRASNALYTAGGGTLLVPAGTYHLGQYTGADVNNTICGSGGVANATVSKLWQVPTNTHVAGLGRATLLFGGGTSSAIGFSSNINVLAWSGAETFLAVTSANNAARSVSMSSTTGLSVGQQVRLARIGGNTSGVPNTPSQEDAPNQFLTIASISSGTVTFREAFIHDFAAAQNLRLAYSTSGAWARNIYFSDLTFGKAPGGTQPYFLLSKVVGSGVDRVTFEDVAGSWGTCEKVEIGSMTVRVIGDPSITMTIESCSRVSIGEFYGYGAGSTEHLGPLFFSDNCREVHIGKYTASNYAQTGLSLLYSFEGRIDHLVLTDCGTAAQLDDFSGALTVGFPAAGALGSYAVATAPGYLMRNLGRTRLSIGKLSIKGLSQVPVRVHDAELTWDTAYIEFANTGTDETAPVVIGQSGARRADATYYPQGGQSQLYPRLSRFVTKAGTPDTVVTSGGFHSLFRQGDTTLASSAASGATTLTVADGSQLIDGAPLYFVDTTSVAPEPASVTPTSISGNTVTITPGLPAALASGAGVWQYQTRANILTRRINLGTVLLDDALIPTSAAESSAYPNFATGTGPYTATVNVTLPSQGDWELSAAVVTADNAHYCTARYLVTYNPINGTFPLAGATLIGKNQVRTNVDITGVSVASGVATMTFQSSASGRSARVFIRLVPLRPALPY